MRLIDADALKQRFDERESDDIELYGGVRIVECFPADEAKEMVDKMPTVDAVVSPCEIGATIFMIVTKRPKRTMPEFSFIKKSYMTEANFFRVCRDFGKTVFLTRAEAEAALAKLNNG